MLPKLIRFLIILNVIFAATTAFALQWTFQPRVSASEEYTSNVFLSEDNEEDDYITVVSAGFTAAALGKTGGLEVSYDPAYTKYLDFDENDAWRHDARLHGWSDLGKRTRFDVWDAFLQTEDPLEEEDILALRDNDVEQEGDPTIRKGRRTFYRNTARARLSHQFGKDDSIYAGFLYGLLRNDDPQEEDNDRYSPSLGLNYWFGPKFGLESNANYTRGEFDRDSDFVGDPTDDFNNYAGSLRFIRRTKTRFSVFVQYNPRLAHAPPMNNNPADPYDTTIDKTCQSLTAQRERGITLSGLLNGIGLAVIYIFLCSFTKVYHYAS